MQDGFVPVEVIENKIYVVRRRKVMLDRDLAGLYGVDVKVLNQAVKRNKERFPSDFVFKLSIQEFENWKSQIVTSNADRMGLRKMPSVFTEQGVAMLSGVLHSKRAITVHVQIIRTFTKLREMLAESDHLQRRLEVMEKQYDEQFKIVFDALRGLITEKEQPKREMGFSART